MESIRLLLISVFLFGAAAVLSLLFRRFSRTARYLSGIVAMIASLVGFLAAIQVFVLGSVLLEFSGSSVLGNFAVRVDGFSAFMVGMISLLAFATSLYSISYLEEYDKRGTGELGFFNNLFIAAMLLVVSVDNAFYFLIFWESMTLASYFLVIF